MSRRLRVAHLVVQPVLVWDDGDELTPGPQVQAVTVPLSGVAGLVEAMPEELARLEAQSFAEGVED